MTVHCFVPFWVLHYILERMMSMLKLKRRSAEPQTQTLRKLSPLQKIMRQWQLHVLLLAPIAYILIFHYWPMYGAQIAFRQYNPRHGIWGSEFVGLKWFEKFITNINFGKYLRNTLSISLYSLAVGFPIPIVFALLINAVSNARFKKFVQSVAYMPHFISVVVLVNIVFMVFSPINGIYGALYRLLGGTGYPEDFRNLAGSFRHLYVWSGIWQNLGWDTIIYTAALASVSQEHHEAAMIDGATRWKRILHVDLPTILPTIGIMLIMRFGHVMSVGFEKAYLMQNVLNYETSEVISTFVYKTAMGSSSQFSYASAIGLFNSVINCFLLILVNWITKLISSREVSLF